MLFDVTGCEKNFLDATRQFRPKRGKVRFYYRSYIEKENAISTAENVPYGFRPVPKSKTNERRRIKAKSGSSILEYEIDI